MLPCFCVESLSDKPLAETMEIGVFHLCEDPVIEIKCNVVQDDQNHGHPGWFAKEILFKRGELQDMNKEIIQRENGDIDQCVFDQQGEWLFGMCFNGFLSDGVPS